ncbi:PAS domain-containing protein [Iodidimonas muriae]|nr:PAS domain-containing protein [Iodidimonas muriae]
MLRELFTYWNSLRNGRFAPSRNDICPSHIPRLLRHILLVDVAEGQHKLRVRLMGTRLVNCFDRDLTGQILQNTGSDPLGSVLAGYCRSALQERHPVAFGPMQCHMQDNDVLIHETLALPLSADMMRINMILMGISSQPRSAIGPLAG